MKVEKNCQEMDDMSVLIRGMEMPEICEQCRWFNFRGVTGDGKWLLDARCKMIKPTQDWYVDECPDTRGGWIGEDIDPANKRGYYYYHHCVEHGTRAKQCPLLEVKGWEGDMSENNSLVRFADCNTIGEALELLKKRVADAPHKEVVETVRELFKTCVERGW